MKRKVIATFIVLALIAIYGAVGNLDRQDAIRDRDQYCKMVHQNRWPDYRGISKTECARAKEHTK